MFAKLRQLYRYAKAGPELIKALEAAELEIISLLNEGDFKRRVVLDLGYIQDAVKRAKGEPITPREPYDWDQDFDEDDR